MSKARQDVELAAQLDSDFTWRLKEISDLKSSIKAADARARAVLLRAMVALCYAHWEGFVRFSGNKYMDFLVIRRMKFNELNRQFYKNHFVPRIMAFQISKPGLVQSCDFIDQILDSRESRFTRINPNIINTKANLNCETYAEICLVCGLDVGFIQPSETFIDVILLKRRNAIAHGEDTLIGEHEVDDIANQTIAHMRAFKDAIENAVFLKQYQAA